MSSEKQSLPTKNWLVDALMVAANYAERVSPGMSDPVIVIYVRANGLYFRGIQRNDDGDKPIVVNVMESWTTLLAIPDENLRDHMVRMVDHLLENFKRKRGQESYKAKRDAGSS